MMFVYYFYCLIPYSLTFYLEIYIFGHLLSGFLLNVTVTGYCHIYYQAHVCFFLFDYYTWFIVMYMSICYYLQIPQYHYIFILCYSIWILLTPVICIYLFLLLIMLLMQVLPLVLQVFILLVYHVSSATNSTPRMTMVGSSLYCLIWLDG